MRAPDYASLFRLVREHRKANNIPMGPLWEAQVEDELCQLLPAGFCKEEEPGTARRNVFSRIDWDDVVRGTQTIAAWAVQGFRHVDQALADSRADTCSRCYYNVQIGGICGACQHLQNLSAKLVAGKTTTSDHFLKACAVCRCSLQVKVWTPIEAIDKGTPPEQLNQLPGFCWIGHELTEFRKAITT